MAHYRPEAATGLTKRHTDRQTDRQTDHGTPCVAIGRYGYNAAAMQLNNITSAQRILTKGRIAASRQCCNIHIYI